MRPFLPIAFFLLAALVAACGGGGGASAPGLPSAPHAGSTPLTYTKAAMTLKIPAQPKTPGIKRPAYVSPNTKSVEVYVFPVTSATPSASPSPSAAQIFPVTTPSPCSQAPDGSKTCTFDVQAPLGMDAFVVLTYADASPGPTSIPLAVFESGAVNVSAGGTPPPLNFALSGLVTSVDVAVASPQPSFTPSTQFATVGVAFSPMPLSLTPRDQSGSPVITDTFVSPVTVNVNPSNAGVTLGLAAPSQCSPASSASGSSAAITCAKDINDVTYTYDGTIAYDTTADVLDHILISAQPQISPTAPPGAFIALGGTVLSYSLPSAGVSGNTAPTVAERQSDGTIRYIEAEYGFGTALGRFDPSNPASATAVLLPYYAGGFASDAFGNIWVADHLGSDGSVHNALQCYNGISTTAAATVPLVVPSSGPLTPFAVTRDGGGNIWYYAQDAGTYAFYAGYLTVGAGCSASTSPLISVGSLSDYPQTAISDGTTGATPGVYLQSQVNGNVYHVTTASSSPVSTPIISPGSTYGQGLALDALGNLYSSFYPYSGPSTIDQFTTASMLNVATLSPDASTPGSLAVFSPTGTYPTRLAYAENGGVGMFDPSVPYSAGNLQIVPFGAQSSNATFYDVHGDPWLMYTDPSNAERIAHIIRTSVWTAVSPVSAMVYGSPSTQAIGVMETGDSGPFTVTNISDPTVATAATPWPGIDHDVLLTMSGAAGSGLSVTISDAHGRSQVVTFDVSMGALARRHLAAIRCIRGRHAATSKSPC